MHISRVLSCYSTLHLTYVPCSKSYWSLWRHQMETHSALLAISKGNPPVTGGFPSQRSVTRSLDIFLICAWTNVSANNRDGDLIRHRALHDVSVMWFHGVEITFCGNRPHMISSYCYHTAISVTYKAYWNIHGLLPIYYWYYCISKRTYYSF